MGDKMMREAFSSTQLRQKGPGDGPGVMLT